MCIDGLCSSWGQVLGPKETELKPLKQPKLFKYTVEAIPISSLVFLGAFADSLESNLAQLQGKSLLKVLEIITQVSTFWTGCNNTNSELWREQNQTTGDDFLADFDDLICDQKLHENILIFGQLTNDSNFIPDRSCSSSYGLKIDFHWDWQFVNIRLLFWSYNFGVQNLALFSRRQFYTKNPALATYYPYDFWFELLDHLYETKFQHLFDDFLAIRCAQTNCDPAFIISQTQSFILDLLVSFSTGIANGQISSQCTADLALFGQYPFKFWDSYGKVILSGYLQGNLRSWGRSDQCFETRLMLTDKERLPLEWLLQSVNGYCDPHRIMLNEQLTLTIAWDGSILVLIVFLCPWSKASVPQTRANRQTWTK